MYSWTDTQQADHEVSMRQGGVIIGKLGRDQRSGARDQKRNELGARWAALETAGGLDKVWGWGPAGQGQESGKNQGNVPSVPRFPRFVSPGLGSRYHSAEPEHRKGERQPEAQC